jgi:hypothetical protein
MSIRFQILNVIKKFIQERNHSNALNAERNLAQPVTIEPIMQLTKKK